MKSLRYYIEQTGDSDTPLLFDDRYRLLEILGGGRMSYVVRAEDTITGIIVSLKIAILDSDDNVEYTITSYKREFTTACGFTHTNILRPFMLNIFEGVPYMVMPYCSGGNICKYAESAEALPEEKCWQLLRDVGSGLAYLHGKTSPLVHLDIKPDNILIDNEGRYIITDFDISTVGGKSAKINEVNGTLAYMAPERFNDNAFALTANDIWSLGAMLYEIMTPGQLPFGETGGLMQRGGEPLPDMPKGYSLDLCELVRNCLSDATWKRPTAKSISQIAEKHLS